MIVCGCLCLGREPAGPLGETLWPAEQERSLRVRPQRVPGLRCGQRATARVRGAAALPGANLSLCHTRPECLPSCSLLVLPGMSSAQQAGGHPGRPAHHVPLGLLSLQWPTQSSFGKIKFRLCHTWLYVRLGGLAQVSWPDQSSQELGDPTSAHSLFLPFT